MKRLCNRNFTRIIGGLSNAVYAGCVLAPLLFNIFFAVVINVASTRFTADKAIMDALVHLRKRRGAVGSNCRRVSSPRDAALGHALR